ncbi:TPA: hypothetical protein ACSVPQ_002577 [Clostridioides difficile]|uniref:hypothetical protein n=1 Tax=Clostridioides difficile TaxID=1496 RepID=UPI000BB18203|nr:hypothetical protein [Clostridioides difficile]EGT3642198.1 hypothetical protein [Clostridioides difficile]MBH7168566.1 hypothetical protein [Clostridioides difficile]MBY1346111.1 hypothetical protein [Clostridioides difficile]MCW0772859.1 hypothetical protein [Clostridioides difficile]MDI2978737.1 hypothetical protein [Clostridioides difficile]
MPLFENLKDDVMNTITYKMDDLQEIFSSPDNFLLSFNKNTIHDIDLLCMIGSVNQEELYKELYFKNIDGIVLLIKNNLEEIENLIVLTNIKYKTGEFEINIEYNDERIFTINIPEKYYKYEYSYIENSLLELKENLSVLKLKHKRSRIHKEDIQNQINKIETELNSLIHKKNTLDRITSNLSSFLNGYNFLDFRRLSSLFSDSDNDNSDFNDILFIL